MKTPQPHARKRLPISTTVRAEEIEAIEKAIEIIGSGAVAGNADKHLPAMETGSSFAQLRTRDDGNQAKVAKFLQAASDRLGSRVLSLVAQRIESDTFVKVKKMIKDLITKLMEEAAAESEHKGWCDEELSTNKQTRKEKTAGVEALHAQIDEVEASIAKLTSLGGGLLGTDWWRLVCAFQGRNRWHTPYCLSARVHWRGRSVLRRQLSDGLPRDSSKPRLCGGCRAGGW